MSEIDGLRWGGIDITTSEGAYRYLNGYNPGPESIAVCSKVLLDEVIALRGTVKTLLVEIENA